MTRPPHDPRTGNVSHIDLLVRRADVVRGGSDGLRLERDVDLVIRGGRIDRLEPGGSVPPDAAAEVLEAAGLVAMPGLVNTHAHVAMTLFRGVAEDVTIDRWFNDIIWRMETNLTPGDVYWGAKLAIAESLLAGVTTISDHYPFMNAVARACSETGIRAHLAPTMFGSEADRELEDARAFHANWHGAHDGRIEAWLGPHSPYLCSAEFLERVAEVAAELGCGVHLHVSETAAQVAASLETHRATPPAYLERLGLLEGRALFAHAAHATPEDIALLAGRGVGVAHCPKTFLRLASGIVDLTAMLGAGVRVGFGTDGAASNFTLDILEQMRLAAMLQKHERRDATVVPRGEALSLASMGGARALGTEDSVGALEPGFAADVILVRLDAPHVRPLHDPIAALVYGVGAADVVTTIVAGQVLMRDRTLLTIDLAEVYAEVEERLPRLTSRPDARLQTFPAGE